MGVPPGSLVRLEQVEHLARRDYEGLLWEVPDVARHEARVPLLACASTLPGTEPGLSSAETTTLVSMTA